MRLLFAVVLLSLALVAPAAAQQAQGNGTERGITVVGEAVGFADNDIAVFRFGVAARRPTAARALRATSAVQRLVIGRLRAAGIARADIRTVGISVSRSGRVRGRRTFIASNSIVVTVRQLARSGAYVDLAVRAGATNVSGPEFSVGDLESAYRRVLGAAFADARAKAERLAAEAGVALGPAVRIVENRAAEREGDFEDTAAAQGEAQPVSAQPTPVSPGRTRVEAGVLVTFATG